MRSPGAAVPFAPSAHLRTHAESTLRHLVKAAVKAEVKVETAKLNAETAKLKAETAKLNAETVKLKAETSLRAGKAGSLTYTEFWNSRKHEVKEETAEMFFANSGISKAKDTPELPEEFVEWAKHDGPEVKRRQPLFMCAIARALRKAAERPVGDVNEYPRKLTFPDGRTLVHTNGQPWLDGLIPDFGLFAPSHSPDAFGALLLIEMDQWDATDTISTSHNGKLLAYLHRLVSTSAFRELYRSRTYGIVTTGTQVRFASYDGDKTQCTGQLPMKEAWEWLWALLTASPLALGRTVPRIFAGTELVPLQGCLGRGSFAAVFTPASDSKSSDKSDPSYFKVAVAKRACAIENEVKVLGALCAASAGGPKAPVAATLSVAGVKEALATIPEAPAPARPATGPSHEQVEEELRKLLKGVETSEVGCLPQLMAYGHCVLQASPVFVPVTSREGYTVHQGHIVDGLANLFRMSKRDVAHGEIAPRHCGTFNNRLGFYDFGCGNVGGNATLAFSGGHWFASDRLLRLHVERRPYLVVKPADDVESFVKTIFVLLYPQAMVNLTRAAGDGSINVGMSDWQGILGFWESLAGSPFWSRALRAAREGDWPWLFKKLPHRGMPPCVPGKLAPPGPNSAPCPVPTRMVKAKASGKSGKLHRPECHHVADQDVVDVDMPLADAKEQGLLCKTCFRDC